MTDIKRLQHHIFRLERKGKIHKGSLSASRINRSRIHACKFVAGKCDNAMKLARLSGANEVDITHRPYEWDTKFTAKIPEAYRERARKFRSSRRYIASLVRQREKDYKRLYDKISPEQRVRLEAQHRRLKKSASREQQIQQLECEIQGRHIAINVLTHQPVQHASQTTQKLVTLKSMRDQLQLAQNKLGRLKTQGTQGRLFAKGLLQYIPKLKALRRPVRNTLRFTNQARKNYYANAHKVIRYGDRWVRSALNMSPESYEGNGPMYKGVRGLKRNKLAQRLFTEQKSSPEAIKRVHRALQGIRRHVGSGQLKGVKSNIGEYIGINAVNNSTMRNQLRNEIGRIRGTHSEHVQLPHPKVNRPEAGRLYQKWVYSDLRRKIKELANP